MRYVWDEHKRRTNLAKHGLDFANAEARFGWSDAVIVPGHASSRGGARHIAVGFLDGDLVALVFSMLGDEAMSFISLRPASKKERKLHDASQATGA